MPRSDCVSEAELRALLLGELPETLSRSVTLHLETCQECEATARRLDTLTDSFVSTLRHFVPSRPAGDETTTLAAPDITSAVAVSLPERIGGYHLLAELGRGGMSVVYKARQAHPERVVALKMILAGPHAKLERRARFLAEADAIARLQHPQIVRIFEAGQHDGLPFLALEFMAGGSLAQRLGGRPQPSREAAALLEGLARTVEYAHRQGVVHRDLKPANILLTEEGQPKLADFGLAKHADFGLTESGAILGTPAYMAPEQATGDNRAVGPAADIYSLGAVLYELLTGRPPFQGATALETLEQCCSQEPVPPSHLQGKLPRDLNTICLKCLHNEPERRYASAADLAADLGRFLRGEPIRARPANGLERFGKWVKRRPVMAVSLAISTTAVIGLLLAWISFTLDVRRERDRADARERDAVEARRRAEVSRNKALATIDRFLTRLGNEQLANVPGMDVLRRDMLQDAVELQTALLNDLNDDDPVVRRHVGLGLQKVAVIHVWLGQREREEQAYRQALEIQQRLAADFPDDATYRRDLGKTLHHLAVYARRFKTRSEAEDAFRRAFDVRENLVRRYSDKPEYRTDLAQSLISYALVYRQTDLKRTRELYLQALALQEAVLLDGPDVEAYQRDVGTTQNKLAALDFYTNNFREAEATFLRVRDWLLRRVEADPKNDADRANLAGAYGNLAAVYCKTGRYLEALAAYENALAIQVRVAAEHPDVPDNARIVGTTHLDMGILCLNHEQWDRASVSLEAALQVAKPLADRFPREVAYRRLLAAAHTNLCLVHRSGDRWASALSHSQTATAILEQLLREQPASFDFMELMAAAGIHLSNDWLIDGNAPESKVAIDLAIRLLEDIRQREPRYGEVRELLPTAYRTRGDLHAWLGHFDSAFKDWEDAAALETRGEEHVRQTRLTNQALRLATKGDHRGACALIEALHKEFSGRLDSNLTCRFAWTYTLAAAAARADSRLTKEEQIKLAESDDRHAIDALRIAQRTGYFNNSLGRRLLQIDPILARLRMGKDVLLNVNSGRP